MNLRWYLAVAAVVALAMGVVVPRLTPDRSDEWERITPEQFDARYDVFVAAHRIGDDESGVPVVQADEGDLYLRTVRYQYEPRLVLKKGASYRLRLYSADVLHGFNLHELGLRFEVAPGYLHTVPFTPEREGEFPLICDEFCGEGHHAMEGLLTVRSGG